MVYDKHHFGGHREDGEKAEETTWYEGVCSECHETFQVPFKPDPDRPLYCRKCFRAVRESRHEHSRTERRVSKPSHDRQHSGELYEITCSHCGKQDMVPFKPYEDSIVLCHECKSNPNIERVAGRIYHTIICAVCGRESKVPFKPDAGSRVLCRECHMAERAEKQRSAEYFSKHHPSVVNNTKVRIEIRCERCGAVDTLPFMPKTHGAILCRQCGEEIFGDGWAKRNRVSAQEYPFTCARCSAQDFVPFKPKPGQELLCRHCLNDEVILTHKRDEMKRHDAFSCVRKGGLEHSDQPSDKE